MMRHSSEASEVTKWLIASFERLHKGGGYQSEAGIDAP